MSMLCSSSLQSSRFRITIYDLFHMCGEAILELYSFISFWNSKLRLPQSALETHTIHSVWIGLRLIRVCNCSLLVTWWHGKLPYIFSVTNKTKCNAAMLTNIHTRLNEALHDLCKQSISSAKWREKTSIGYSFFFLFLQNRSKKINLCKYLIE